MASERAVLVPVIRSQLNPRAEEFRANAARMRTLVQDLREKVAKAALGGDEAARAKHTARGKLLPRERRSEERRVGKECRL